MIYLTVFAFILLSVLGPAESANSQLESFTEHPENYTAVLGERHNFSCNYESVFPNFLLEYHWTITTRDGINLITSHVDDIAILTEMGIQHNKNIVAIPSNSETNGSIVICQIKPANKFSQPAVLTVLGPPTPPEPALRAVNNTLVISWAPAWSWPDHPVIHYTVTLTNTTNGSVYTNLTNQTVLYFTREEEAELRCDVMVVNVTATSDIGESEAGQVVGGFPIPPPPFEMMDCEECKVTLILPSTTPIYTFQFKLPDICPYQEAGHYTVQLHGPGWITQLVEKTEYTTSNTTEPITMEVDSGLTINNTYSVVVLVSNSEGSTNATVTFNTEIEIHPIIVRDPTIIATENKSVRIAVIVIGVILLGAVVMVVIVIACMYKRRRRRSAAELNLAKMIMEGTTERPSRGGPYVQNETIYESIDDFQEKTTDINITHPPSLPSARQSREHLYTPDRLNVPMIVLNGEKDRDSNGYLQLLCSDSGKNNAGADVRSTGSGEYTSMKSVSVQNHEMSAIAAENKLAIQTPQGFNEDDYMVFMEQEEKY